MTTDVPASDNPIPPLPEELARAQEQAKHENAKTRAEAIKKIGDSLECGTDISLHPDHVNALCDTLINTARSRIGAFGLLSIGEPITQQVACAATTRILRYPGPNIGSDHIDRLFESFFAPDADTFPTSLFIKHAEYLWFTLFDEGKPNLNLHERHFQRAGNHAIEKTRPKEETPDKPKPDRFATDSYEKIIVDLMAMKNCPIAPEDAKAIYEGLQAKDQHGNRNISQSNIKTLSRILHARSTKSHPLSDQDVRLLHHYLYFIAASPNNEHRDDAFIALATSTRIVENMADTRMEVMKLPKDPATIPAPQNMLQALWQNICSITSNPDVLSIKQEAELVALARVIDNTVNTRPGLVPASGYQGQHFSISPKLAPDQKHAVKIITRKPEWDTFSIRLIDHKNDDEKLGKNDYRQKQRAIILSELDEAERAAYLQFLGIPQQAAQGPSPTPGLHVV